MPDGIHFTVNIATIIFGLLLLFGILNLLLGQLRNIVTNSTSMERSQAKKKPVSKKSTILTDDNLDDSLAVNEEEEEVGESASCCANITEMLSGPN